LKKIFDQAKPDVVINCIGIIKQKNYEVSPDDIIFINAVFPHNLFKICQQFNSRLIQISTDCVFKGDKGDYSEDDICDATDLYGKTKFLGELHYLNSVTLRTSIIGFESNSNYSLLEWFLSQKDSVHGYSKAIFSGLTTLELAHVIVNHVIPNSNIQGLYHVSSEPISKFNLLKKLNIFFNKKLVIINDVSIAIDRSLNSNKFYKETGYSCPEWDKLIKDLINFGRNGDLP
jgi:dTDP-4-dehydrorhamnose reductase